MNKFASIFASAALILTVAFGSTPVQAAPVAVAPVAKVAPAKAKAVQFELRAYTLEQAVTQCKGIKNKATMNSCIKAANATNWGTPPKTIKMVRDAVSQKRVSDMIKKNTKRFMSDAIKYETSPRFERDIAVCEMIAPINTKAQEKKNGKKLSDCINATIAAHQMYA